MSAGAAQVPKEMAHEAKLQVVRELREWGRATFKDDELAIMWTELCDEKEKELLATATAEEKTKPEKVPIVDIERFGEKLILPANLSWDNAIAVLQRQKRYEEEEVAFNEEFVAFPWDGANALQLALKEKFGFVNMQRTPTFFGSEPPQMMTVWTGPKTKIQVPWGRMSIPAVKGYLETSVSRTNEGRFIFRLGAVVKRKHEGTIKEIGELVRKYLLSDSIYRGKGVRIRFKDDNGNPHPIPDPKFLDLSNVKEEELVLPLVVDNAIKTSLFTPIERSEECKRHGIPLKRGILMAGPFGVGKTLAAYVTAKKAQENNWTFLYCERSTELADSIRFAHQYSPAVVFCEDIDRITTGDRTVEMDELLNILDGIDAKDTELMVVLTTNEVEKINQALLRPGRLDAVIYISPPDAKAAEKLVRQYGRGLVDPKESLDKTGKVLEGQIPAVIREVVERSKLGAIRLTEPGKDLKVTDEALVDAALTMRMHQELLKPKEKDQRTEMEKFGEVIGKHVKAGIEYVGTAQGGGVKLDELVNGGKD